MSDKPKITPVATTSKWWVQKWNVESSTGDKVYRVALDKNGDWGCDCPAWKFRRQECRHIRAVKEQAGPAAEPQPETMCAGLLRRCGQAVEVVRNGEVLGVGTLGKLASWDDEDWFSVVSVVYRMDDGQLTPDFSVQFTAGQVEQGEIELRKPRSATAQPAEPVREVAGGASVWAVVENAAGQVVRIKGTVVAAGREIIRFRSNRTEREYEVPTYLVFHRRPEQTIIETAYVT